MSVPILLDTHILLWIRIAPNKLSKAERAVLDEAPSRHVSTITFWELAVLMSLGRLARDEELLAVPEGFEGLDITARHARELLLLPALHRDPFDRMLIAQARVERLALLTRDKQIGSYADSHLSVLGF